VNKGLRDQIAHLANQPSPAYLCVDLQQVHTPLAACTPRQRIAHRFRQRRLSGADIPFEQDQRHEISLKFA